MHSGHLVFGLLAIPGLAEANSFKPFLVDLSHDVPRMLDLIQSTVLPAYPEWPGLGAEAGISLADLGDLRQEWLTSFNWTNEEADLNRYNHFTADIENLTIHFIHHKSGVPGAIPLLLNHGWPGSFLEFLPLVDSLTEKNVTSDGNSVSFDVVIPSMPGFGFSSAAPLNWTTADTARVFNTLMTDVLGYQAFAVHGTDWGAAPAYTLYEHFPNTTRAAHFVFLPFLPHSTTQLAEQNFTLSPLEQEEAARGDEWFATGNGYFIEQTTKDNPVGQLAWVGEKILSWSDPQAGTAPSLLTHNEILRTVSLYFLTRTFTSSVFVYYQNQQNQGGFRTAYEKPATDAPLLFSAFRYNVGFWPPALVAKVGNLVQYRNHERGGHFPGLDNPTALVEDLREIARFWS